MAVDAAVAVTVEVSLEEAADLAVETVKEAVEIAVVSEVAKAVEVTVTVVETEAVQAVVSEENQVADMVLPVPEVLLQEEIAATANRKNLKLKIQDSRLGVMLNLEF